ncbi:helix-turn-helix domain-containing protein [Aquicoccus sp.]|uniref:helix-turn-helix domain-containing protein n=1 Tax=Aquicoccus sp. TaxID=2055851 RepID=UPI00356ACE32
MSSKSGYSESVSNTFEAFDLRLSDIMRGERATLGKSLLDVQSELRIKASYIAAIENADLTAFDNPGLIAGYVRSYARYLNLDPDLAFDTFCRESGFTPSRSILVEKTARSSREPFQKVETISQPASLMARGKNFAKAVLFALFYPALMLIDLAIWIAARITTREAGSSLSFQGVSPETTDWWTFFAIVSGGLTAVLVYFSGFVPFADDWASRTIISLGTGACVTITLAWFNPRMFFARLTLALLLPIFLSSLFGVEISLDANGDRFGGLVEFGADTDPVTTIVVGVLCALAMILHRRRS